ncbi:kinase-like domain-containing protein [Lipomyces kononenkoae]
MAPGGNKADIQNAKAKLIESYNQILEEFTTGSELTNVGNYALSRMIGKGSFGKVYLATHKLTGTKVSSRDRFFAELSNLTRIQVVLKSAEKSDLNLAREIHHYRQLLHPHIARLYEVIITESTVWLVLEYCPGDELYAYLLRKRRLSIDQTQRIFAQLCGAVAYIHAKNIVHRDLKLENILMDKHESVKLCDFGFTRECEPKRLLQTFCGTICYAAPEMVKGEKYHGQSVDVWSLGIILYALLCGELPFDDDDEVQTRLRISNDEPVYPDHLPDEALSLLRLMLSKRPSERPSATEILQHPFLTHYSSAQTALLHLPDPVPFTTKPERDLLDRLRHAFVDIDALKESVIKQKCDNMAGWWALALESEERNFKKHKKKRKSDKYKRSAEGSLTGRDAEASTTLKKPPISESNAANVSESVEATPGLDGAPEKMPIELPLQPANDSTGKKRGLVGVFATVKHWASVSHLGLKRSSLPRAGSNSRGSSLRSLLLLGGTSTKSKTPTGNDNSAGNGRNTPKATWDKARKGPADAQGSGAVNVRATDSEAELNLSQDNQNGEVLLPEDLERQNDAEENGGILKSQNGRRIRRHVPPPVKIAVPNRMYSSDSMNSASRDRRRSPSSSYVSRIGGRTSTSSSVSSLISASRHKSTLSRTSSTSSNSISSSRNASRSPRSSSRYLPSTPTVDHFDRGRKSWRQYDRKHTRMQSYDDDGVSFTSTTASMGSAQSSTPNTTVRSSTGFGNGVDQYNRIGRYRTGLNEAGFFGFGQGSARDVYERSPSKRKKNPFRGHRGRKGVRDSGGGPVLRGLNGSDARTKSAEGPIEELDEAETVEDEGELSDDEGVNSRRASLAD